MFDTLTRLGASGASTGYKIQRSLRFNSADSAALKRTPSSDGDRQKWTISLWWKKGKWNITSGGTEYLCAAKLNANNNDGIYIHDDEILHFKQELSGNTKTRQGTRRLRDTSGWYHIVVAQDTTQGDADDRLKVWINGQQETMSGNTIGENSSGNFSRDCAHYIGSSKNSSNANPLAESNGYIADFHFIDGSQLDYTSFAETDSETGVYIPKKYTGSYGSNGFKLNFSDNSDVTAATLGADSSGNGNDFTPVNMSVSAGPDNDSVTDTPTNNYCVLNQNYQNGSEEPGAISDGSLKFVPNGSEYEMCPGTLPVQDGKYYFEVKHGGGSYLTVGLIRGTGGSYDQYISYDPLGQVYGVGYNRAGNIVGASGDGATNGATLSSSPSAFTTNDIIGVATDVPNGTVKFYKNGTGEDELEYTLTGLNDHEWFPAVSGYNSSDIAYVNFGQQGFTYTPPTGHKAICTDNMAATSIKKPQDYFKPKIYTGTVTEGGTQTESGIGFQPDLTWIKRRDDGNSSHIVDSQRGAGKYIESSSPNAESASNTNGLLTAFTSDGFTLTGGSTNAVLCCEETATYVAWNWKEDASTAGFDIVLDEGTGLVHTVPHSLGAKPELILRKGRTQSENWSVYSPYLNANDATEYLKLNEGDVQANLNTIWDDTPPTNSVFTVGTNGVVNEDDVTYVSYLFKSVPGFSRIGFYKGNDDNFGPFVYCGFQPAFVMTKRMDSSAGSWLIYDNVRTTENPMHINLYADLPDEEFTNTGSDPQMDFYATGFKIKSSYHSINHSDGPHLFVAFAHTPTKYNSTAY